MRESSVGSSLKFRILGLEKGTFRILGKVINKGLFVIGEIEACVDFIIMADDFTNERLVKV